MHRILILFFSGYQAVPQHHPVTFQQGPSHYSRPSIGTGRKSAQFISCFLEIIIELGMPFLYTVFRSR